MKENENIRYPLFDVYRGIAALAVMVYHYTVDFFDIPMVLKIGVTGVDLFFMISGYFAIVYINKYSSKQYLINRFSRVFPTYWVALFLTIFFLLLNFYWGAESRFFYKEVLLNFAMLQHFFGLPNVDGAYWTLAVELQFYLFIWVLIRFNQIKFMWYYVYFILGVGLFVFVWLQPNSYYFKLYYQFFPLLPHFPMFVLGMLIAYGISNIEKVFLGLLSIFIVFLSYGFVSRAEGIVPIRIYIVVIIVYFLLLWIGKNNFKIAPSKYLLFFGMVSYPLYLTHQYIGKSFIVYWLTDYFSFSYLFSITIAMIFSILLAYLLNRLIEKPCIVLIRKYFFTH